MLPLSTIRQSLAQARQASKTLRSLLQSNSEPSADEVRACMEAGAQAQWMSKQGTHSAEHALSVALSKGYAAAAEVILEFSDRLPTPRDHSFYTLALGKRGIYPHPEDYTRCVSALLNHGYTFKEQESVSLPALYESFSSGLLAHAAILLEAGAASVLDDKEIAEKVLIGAMSVRGGVGLLLQHAPVVSTPHFENLWWWCALRTNQNIPDMTEVVRVGLDFTPPSDYVFVELFKQSPFLLAEVLIQGYEPTSRLPFERWDDNGKLEPLWRHAPHCIYAALHDNPSTSALGISDNESQQGLNWLSFVVKEEGWAALESWRTESRAIAVRAILDQARTAGLDVHSRDSSGKTAGWYVLSSLIDQEAPRNSRDGEIRARPENTKEWLDLVEDFSLAASPVLENGQEVPFLAAEEGKMANFLRRHGRLERVVATTESWQMDQHAPATTTAHSVRRM